MDGKTVVYAPAWLKFGVIFILSIALLMGFYITYQLNIENKDSGWILASIAVVQTASSALVIALMIFFSNRDPSELEIKKKSKKFIDLVKRSVLGVNEMANTPGGEFYITDVVAKSGGVMDEFCQINLRGGESFHAYFSINIKRFVYCLYIDSSKNTSGVSEMADLERSICDKLGIQFVVVDRYEDALKSTVTIFQFNVDTDDYEFLLNPTKMMYVANDVANTLRWVLLEVDRLGVGLK